MAIVGHTAASKNIFLDILFFLRGLSQSMYGEAPAEIMFTKRIWEEIERVPDRHDPTEILDEYYDDWWNKDSEWQTRPVIMVDQDKAFRWHIQKVRLKSFSLSPDLVDNLPIGSMENFGETSVPNRSMAPHHRPQLLLLPVVPLTLPLTLANPESAKIDSTVPWARSKRPIRLCGH
jgi:hypothetical protein